MTREEKFRQILAWFSEHQPHAETELIYDDPYQLLVAVILSAQCTDKRVNMLTGEFFRHFPDPASLASADHDTVFELIRSCSYPNNKTKHLLGMARKLLSDFGGKVPAAVEALQTLPGVGRKTANVVASVVWKLPAMAVDTHVFRVSARLGLTVGAKTPREAENQLVRYIPPEKIHLAHHWLILHGRYTCQARKPKCDACPLTGVCTYFGKQQKTIPS
ncbi:MAG TPA: endonuclease III [Bacteroidales bacterium]|nr:endonuclease III [Bacteroidales bacterium]HSA42648.1 endonuclease III [Bacteroidales bacterium]